MRELRHRTFKQFAQPQSLSYLLSGRAGISPQAREPLLSYHYCLLITTTSHLITIMLYCPLAIVFIFVLWTLSTGPNLESAFNKCLLNQWRGNTAAFLVNFILETAQIQMQCTGRRMTNVFQGSQEQTPLEELCLALLNMSEKAIG